MLFAKYKEGRQIETGSGNLKKSTMLFSRKHTFRIRHRTQEVLEKYGFFSFNVDVTSILNNLDLQITLTLNKLH